MMQRAMSVLALRDAMYKAIDRNRPMHELRFRLLQTAIEVRFPAHLLRGVTHTDVPDTVPPPDGHSGTPATHE